MAERVVPAKPVGPVSVIYIEKAEVECPFCEEWMTIETGDPRAHTVECECGETFEVAQDATIEFVNLSARISSDS